MSLKKAKREEARILKTRGKFKSELLKWVTNPDHKITQDVNKFIDFVMKDRRRRIEVFLTALASKHVERAVYFMGRLPEIEDELLKPARIKTMKNADLIRLLGVVADQVGGASEFLRNFVTNDDLRSEPLPSPGAEFGAGEKEVIVDDVSNEERQAAAELPIESKQRIGSILMKVLKTIDGIDGSHTSLLPAPVEGVDDTDEKKSNTTKKKLKDTKKLKGGR